MVLCGDENLSNDRLLLPPSPKDKKKKTDSRMFYSFPEILIAKRREEEGKRRGDCMWKCGEQLTRSQHQNHHSSTPKAYEEPAIRGIKVDAS